MAPRKIEIKSYRGRLTATDIFRAIAIILAILVLASGGVYLYTQGGGSLPQLEHLFSQKGEEPPQLEPPAPEPEPTPAPEPVPTPEPEPLPEPEPEPEPLRAVELSLAEAQVPSAVPTITEQGGNGVILDMKADNGKLGFYSEHPLITQFPKAIKQTAEDTAALKNILESDLHTVARISGFKDDIVGNNVDYAILSNSGFRWTDPEKIHWSCPTRLATRQYLLQCIVETAELGFDEILLDNFGYPDRGNLHYIRHWEYYDLNELSTVMTEFFMEIDQALADYPDVTLSVRVPAEVLDGTDTRTGLTLDTLEKYADSIWIEASSAELLTQLEPSVPENVVLITETFDSNLSSPQGLLSSPSF